MRQSGLLAWGLLAAVVSLPLAIGCQPNARSTPSIAESAPVRVRAFRLEKAENPPRFATYYGLVKPRRSSQLGFARGGRIESIAKQVGDSVNADERIASLDLESLEADLKAVDESLKAAEEKLQRYESNLNVNIPRQDVEAVRQEVAQWKRQQTELQVQLKRGRIVAPYDCVIAERFFDEGDSVAVGRPLYRVLDSGPPQVEVDVPATLAAELEGDAAGRIQIQLDAAWQDATIVHRSPEIDPASRTVRLVIETEAEAEWRFGEAIAVRLLTPNSQPGFWAPMSALRRNASGQWALLVIESGDEDEVASRTVEHLIDVAYIAAERVLIAAGDDPSTEEQAGDLKAADLKAGDLVLLEGLHRVAPGQLVDYEVVDNPAGSATAEADE